MKRFCAILLAMMMVLSLTACGDNNADLVGTWKWTYDATDLFNQSMNEAVGTDIQVDAKVELVYVMTFNEDGTCAMTIDKDAVVESVNGYLKAMVPAMVELVYQQVEAQGMSRADMDALLKQQGVDMTEYVEQMLDSLDAEQLLSGLEEAGMNGYYRAAKGKLFISEKENSFDKDDYAEYTLENGVMKWTDGSNAAVDSLKDAGVSFPMEWVKQ